MKSAKQDRISRRGYCLLSCAALLGAGLVVGLPALDGGYLGADDEHLIRDHALVNHPSLAHAIKLFAIAHRDLYQPIPLLTFQIEFALHGGNVGIMHLTNVVIHMINGILVWVLFRLLVGGRFVPLMVALLFIVHPLSVECFAWLNGRMIMLSTTFSLASLIVFDYWWGNRSFALEGSRGLKPAAPWVASRGLPITSGQVPPAARCAPTTPSAVRTGTLIVVMLLLAALAMMSKVRVGLPFLFLLLPVWRRYKPDKKWWLVLGGIVCLTIGFAALNVGFTRESRMFEGAERQLHGPNLARVAMSLGWYFTHYVWPAGLAPYYAPPQRLAWSDPAVPVALAIVAVVGIATVMSWRRSRVGVVGMVWFLVTVASTLPVVPARNLLAADRYVYLPNIGLHWIVASLMFFMFDKVRSNGSRRSLQFLGGLAAVGLLVICAGLSRKVTDYYQSNDARIARVIETSPNHPTLRTAWGWYHLQRGDYARSIELADQELEMFPDDNVAFYRAMNLRAMCRYYLRKDVTGAEADLQAAMERDPNFAKSYFRLGLIYYEQGRLEEAIEQLEVAVDKAPLFNPALNLLGKVYRQTNQLARARRMYEMAVDSSRGYDVEAIEALAELDIQQGRSEQAVERYRALFSWHDVEVPARLNLALALRTLNRGAEAWEQYRELLRGRPLDRRVLMAVSDFLRSRGRYTRALEAWRQALRAEPRAADLLSWYGLHQWYNRDFRGAKQSAREVLREGAEQPLAWLTLVLVAVAEGQPSEIATESEAILEAEISADAAMFTYAYEALEFYSVVDTASPWPYYVTTVLLLKQGQFELAQQVRLEFDKRCSEQQWRLRLQELCNQHHMPGGQAE